MVSTTSRLTASKDVREIHPRFGNSRSATFIILQHDTGKLTAMIETLELRPLSNGNCDLHVLVSEFDGWRYNKPNTSRGVYLRLTDMQAKMLQERGVKKRNNGSIVRSSRRFVRDIFTILQRDGYSEPAKFSPVEVCGFVRQPYAIYHSDRVNTSILTHLPSGVAIYQGCRDACMTVADLLERDIPELAEMKDLKDAYQNDLELKRKIDKIKEYKHT